METIDEFMACFVCNDLKTHFLEFFADDDVFKDNHTKPEVVLKC